VDKNGLKEAVILSGGGAFGAYEVGVMEALLTGKSPATSYTRLSPDIFTGTSVGAINASVMVSHDKDFASAIEYLRTTWLDKITDTPGRCGNGIYRFRADPFRYLDPDCSARNPLQPLLELAGDGAFLSRDWFSRGIRFLNSSGTIEQRTLELFSLSSFISVEPFKQLLTNVVDLERIRTSNIVLRIATTNWKTGRVRIFANQDMNDERGYQIILGSAAIPGFFPPYLIDGVPHLDGGLVMNTPLRVAIAAGASVIHVIYLDPDIRNIPLRELEDTINTLEKVYSIMSATITSEDTTTAKWINEGLDVIERAASGQALSDPDMIAFIRVAAEIQKRIAAGTPYKKLTIHQYRPTDLLGGSLGVLDFRRDVISHLLDRGFKDAVHHDCRVGDCILP